jgi:hypothetical protein
MPFQEVSTLLDEISFRTIYLVHPVTLDVCDFFGVSARRADSLIGCRIQQPIQHRQAE